MTLKDWQDVEAALKVRLDETSRRRAAMKSEPGVKEQGIEGQFSQLAEQLCQDSSDLALEISRKRTVTREWLDERIKVFAALRDFLENWALESSNSPAFRERLEEYRSHVAQRIRGLALRKEHDQAEAEEGLKLRDLFLVVPKVRTP